MSDNKSFYLYTVADCSFCKKAKELIGWMPEFGGLDGLRRGLAETVEWFTQKHNLAQYKAEVYNV